MIYFLNKNFNSFELLYYTTLYTNYTVNYISYIFFQEFHLQIILTHFSLIKTSRRRFVLHSKQVMQLPIKIPYFFASYNFLLIAVHVGFLLLISYRSPINGSVYVSIFLPFPTESTKYPLCLKCLSSCLYFEIPCLSNVINELSLYISYYL